MSIEYRPRAERQQSYRQWKVEGITGDPHSVVYGPDGSRYDLFNGDTFILVPGEPIEGQEPRPFVRKATGETIAFDEWVRLQVK